MKNYKRGFTLLEIFFVLGVMAVIMAVVLPSFKGMRDETDAAKAKTELAILQTALESYYSENDRYPESDYQTVLIYQPNNKVINKHFYDPFQSGKQEYDYFISTDGKYYLLRSLGYNRQADLDFAAHIDISAGTAQLSGTGDDFVITNLKEL
jgi:type II secretion system protein G